MAIFSEGTFVREQRLRLGLSQEELCTGICSVANLSRFENNAQPVRLNVYIRLMQRLGQPVQAVSMPVSPADMRRHNIEREILYRMAVHDYSFEELLNEYVMCSKDMDNTEKQFHTYVTAILMWERQESMELVFDEFLKAIAYTYPKFDIEDTSKIRMLTHDEITIINNIAIILRKKGENSKALKWGFFLKEYHERMNLDYEEVTKTYPLILHNLANWLDDEGRYEDAVRLCDLGIEYCNKHGKLNLFAELMHNKGYYLELLERYEEASKYLKYALAIYEARNNVRGQEKAKRILSRVSKHLDLQ